MPDFSAEACHRGEGPIDGALAIAIVEAAPLIVLVLDLAGRIDYANPCFEALVGRSLADFAGADWFSTFLPARERERVRARFRGAFDGDPTRGFTNTIVTAAGEEREVEWHDQILRADAGQSRRLVCVGKDVSDERRGARALAAREANLREAQRIGKFGSWELDLPDGALRWSDEIYRIFGIDPGRFGASYEAFLAAVHPDDRALVDEVFRRSLATRAPYEIIHRLQLADGQVKHVHERGLTVYDADGSPLRTTGTVQDITERVDAELLLKRTLAGMLPLVGLLDRDGRVLELNRSCGEDPRGQLLWELPQLQRAPELQARLQDAVARAAAGEVVQGDFQVPGEPPQVHELRFNPLRDPGGRIEGVLCSGVDVSERRRIEDDLRTHSQVLMAMSEGVVFLDSAGMIRFVNPAIERMFGYPAGELLGRHVTVLNDADPDLEVGINREIMAGVRERGRWEGDIPNRRRDGSVFLSHATITTLERPGETLWVTVQEDVTERRAVEQEVRRSLTEKDTLLREIHHRVKNNLQVISSLLHFQAKRVKNPEDAAVFSEARSRMLAMMLIHERLYQVRDLSQIAFAGYIRALIAALSRTHAQGHVTVDIVADETLLPIELALPSGMILCELITNVFKYAAAGRVSCHARVSARSDGDRVLLTVDDDGVGFPADFDPGAVTTFGWSLVRNLVLQIDGTLVTRTSDGAHVEISFPRAAAAKEAPSA